VFPVLEREAVEIAGWGRWRRQEFRTSVDISPDRQARLLDVVEDLCGRLAD
jgi:hypothetical protein